MANRGRRSKRVYVPAPTGGIDTVTPLHAMAPDTAIRLDNLVIEGGDIGKRKGWLSAGPFGGNSPIIAMHEHYDGAQTRRLIAVEDDFSSANQSPIVRVNVFSASTSATGISIDAVAQVQATLAVINASAVATSGVPIMETFNGRTTIVCEGAVGKQIAAFTDSSTAYPLLCTSSALPSSSAIATLSYVKAFKGRLYFAARNKQGFYYLPLNAVQGSAQYFAVDEVSNVTGEIYSIISWTRDGGDGPDDYFVLLYESGDVVVYQGSDPSSITDWALVGRYKIGRPVSRRSVLEVGGKVFVQTDQDWTILPDALMTQGSLPPNKLTGAAKEAYIQVGSEYGLRKGSPFGMHSRRFFGLHHHRSKGYVIHNVPILISASAYFTSAQANYEVQTHQYVMDISTGAPTRWTDINATCWTDFAGRLLFGRADGTIGLYDADNFDGTDNGTNINIRIDTSFQNGGSPEPKRVVSYTPKIRAGDPDKVRTGVGYDFVPCTSANFTVITLVGTGGDVPIRSNINITTVANNTTSERHQEVFSNYGQGEYINFTIQTSTSARSWYFRGINADVTPGSGFV